MLERKVGSLNHTQEFYEDEKLKELSKVNKELHDYKRQVMQEQMYLEDIYSRMV